MNFGDAIKSCLMQYASFRGRASRSEFWYFFLFAVLVYIVTGILDRMLGTTFTRISPVTGQPSHVAYGYLYTLAAVLLLLPNISVQVRRLHDTGRSGWWWWLALIPLLGFIILLVWFCSRGTLGENDYGHDPLAGGLATTFS